MTSQKYQLSSVTNAMKILNIFKVSERKELSFTEITTITRIPKSTAHRLITSLKSEGFLSQNPRTGKYRLGLTLLTLGGIVSVHKQTYQEAFPFLEQLVREINETCHICLLEERDVVFFQRVHRKDPDHLITEEGRKGPVHCTSEGLILLAYQDKAHQERVLSGPLKRYTECTTTDPPQLRSRLTRIAKEGYAWCEGEYFKDYTSIAVPIRDYSSLVVSSLSLVTQTTRLQGKDTSFYMERLKETADDISEALGYFGDI
ncbi:IclR family transcriptional regulator [Salsuginibacillus kocurii]|uniref:IclR family transcriptional regulator n=1 Tax=Salsuginibacillus kocurii TaxID=427078 RepID=UPI00037ED529|nr:IclR family transcriptional regulator [Salsuginibacillus kocurii]